MGRRQVCHSDCQPPFHGHSFLGFLSGQHFAKTTRDLADFTLICKRPFFVFFLTYDFIIATNFSISRDSLKGPIKWIKNKIETLSFRLWIRACVQLIHCFNVIFIVVMHERFYFQMGSARIVPLDDLHDRHLDDRHGFLTQLHVLHGHPHHHRSDFSVPLPNPLHFRWVPPSDAGDHSLMNTISLSLSLWSQVMELVGPEFRTFAGTGISMFFGLSMALLAGLSYLLPNWYHLALATSVPFVPLFGCVFFSLLTWSYIWY